MSTVHQPDLLPEVSDFLANSPLTGFVAGRNMPSSSGKTFITRDPGSTEFLAEVHAMQPEDVDCAVGAAREAFAQSGWATMPPHERAARLHRLADTIEQHNPILAQLEAIDAGKIHWQAEADVKNLVDTLRYFTDLSQHMQYRTTLAVPRHEAWIVRHPWGPCGFIFPWNFPLLLLGWGIAPALAAGNTVVVKPAEDTPLSTLYVAQLAQRAGIPDGVINVVPGLGEPAGAALAAHPDLKRMSFTGSPEVGRLVGEACGRNLTPVKLELGGKGAAVVFGDVDVDQTAENLVQALTFHTGQVCCDATRWLIDRSIYDRFVEKVCDCLKQIAIGYQMDPNSQMGPVVNQKQLDRILGYLERGQQEGAEAVLEGGLADVSGRNGFYVKPALLAGALDNVAAREEIFGPVAYLAPFDDEGQAVAMANDTDYGLANSVWTRDMDRAARVGESMVAGNSWINAHNIFPHGVPYAGVNRSGMGGGVLSMETLMDYWRSQSVARPSV